MSICLLSTIGGATTSGTRGIGLHRAGMSHMESFLVSLNTVLAPAKTSSLVDDRQRISLLLYRMPRTIM